jgi:hypothetical protein
MLMSISQADARAVDSAHLPVSADPTFMFPSGLFILLTFACKMKLFCSSASIFAESSRRGGEDLTSVELMSGPTGPERQQGRHDWRWCTRVCPASRP